MHTDWFKIVFLKLERNAEVVQAVDITMVQAKRIYILMIKVNKLVCFFFIAEFNRNRNHIFHVSLWL